LIFTHFQTALYVIEIYFPLPCVKNKTAGLSLQLIGIKNRRAKAHCGSMLKRQKASITLTLQEARKQVL
jgi:hypothetical protein